MGLLKSVGAYGTYRHRYHAATDFRSALQLLLFESTFPRSLAHGLDGDRPPPDPAAAERGPAVGAWWPAGPARRSRRARRWRDSPTTRSSASLTRARFWGRPIFHWPPRLPRGRDRRACIRGATEPVSTILGNRRRRGREIAFAPFTIISNGEICAMLQTNEGVPTGAQNDVKNEALAAWVALAVELCEPKAVHWCSGSERENAALLAAMVAQGTLIKLDSDQASGQLPLPVRSARRRPRREPHLHLLEEQERRRADQQLGRSRADEAADDRLFTGGRCADGRCTSSRSPWDRSARRSPRSASSSPTRRTSSSACG